MAQLDGARCTMQCEMPESFEDTHNGILLFSGQSHLIQLRSPAAPEPMSKCAFGAMTCVQQPAVNTAAFACVGVLTYLADSNKHARIYHVSCKITALVQPRRFAMGANYGLSLQIFRHYNYYV